MIEFSQLPSLNALKAFVAVAQHNSVSRAANTLHVTHGAISRQVKQLEDQLGIVLLEKQGRGIKLTDSGQQLYTDAAAALRGIASSCRQIKQQQRQRPIVLACPGSFLARWLIPRLHQLHESLPGLDLQLIANADDEHLQHHGADISLAYLTPRQRRDNDDVLAQERIGAVASPVFARQHGLYNAPFNVLLQHQLLHTYSRPQAWPELAKAQQLDGGSLQLGQGFAHLYYLLEATVAGIGIGIAPEQLVHSDIEQGRLVAPWGFIETSAQLCLTLHHPAFKARITPLVNWLREQLQ